jgi:nitroreductase
MTATNVTNSTDDVVSALLESRRSTRAFVDKGVTEKLVRELLLASGKSPSGGNL